jgi:predicted nucleotidyltransferase
MSRNPVRRSEFREVLYDKRRWTLLKGLRLGAIKTMEVLERANLYAIAHGSVARGDVSSKSDVDIFILDPPSSFKIETVLERAGVTVSRRFLIQPTPYYAIKAYLEVNEKQSISFPLVKMHRVEREFYQFGGEATLGLLVGKARVMGVDKRLMLIEPTEDGHFENSIVGRESETAKLLGISRETVLDRVHAMLRRNESGRTGLFVERVVPLGETFEMALKRLAERKPEVRRRLKLHD